MKQLLTLALAVAVGLLAAVTTSNCGATAAPTVHPGDACARCNRRIANLRLAGAIVEESGTILRFRTPGCMARYLAEHPALRHTAYVTDHQSGEMIKVVQAMFVRTTIDEASGERDYMAFRAVADAVTAAKQRQTSPVDWAAVMTAAGVAARGE